MVSLRKYGPQNSKWLKLEDLHGKGAIVERIGFIKEDLTGKFGARIVITLEPSGRMLSLNKSSVGNLLRDLGDNDRDWLNKPVEVSAGEIDTANGRVDAIVVRGADKNAVVPSKSADVLDDEIPSDGGRA